MAQHSAGLLVHRVGASGDLEVFLVHPGGPFWAKKDLGAWSVPKGEYDPAREDSESAARREFAEEIGVPVPEGTLVDLGSVAQRAGKVVHAFALQAELDVEAPHSNTFQMEWPPRSGVLAEFPEIDKAQWFSEAVARHKLVPAQVELLDRLKSWLEVASA